MLIILAAAAVLIIAFCIWQNNDIVTTEMEFTSKDAPSAFDDFRILQVSDLQNKQFGREQQRLLELSKQAVPDIIVITGDLMDGHSNEMESAMEYAEGAVDIAPVYFISGNHEWLSGRYEELIERLAAAGVTVLDNSSAALESNGEIIELLGLKDPTFGGDEQFLKQLKVLAADKSGFRILLSHHPEYIEAYAKYDIDLVFSGHAHGGQIRLPFIGGLFAPGQGFFPKYTSGLYKVGETSMAVSRGLGNSNFPLRVFNRPELVVVTLRAHG